MGSGTEAMQQLSAPRWLQTGLLGTWAWMLDQPRPVALNGQHCDRLRPARIGQQLLAVLHHHDLGGCTLLDWRWDPRQERVEGWLWQRGLVQRFSWWRSRDQLTMWEQLQCTPTPPLRPLG